MKSVTDYIKQSTQRFLINKDTKIKPKYKVKSLIELKRIVEKRTKNNETILRMEDIDVSGLKDLSYTFYALYSVKVIDITGWDTSNVTDFGVMFKECRDLQEIHGIENIDVSSGIRFSNMFELCGSLKKLNLSNWKLTSSDDLNCIKMFSGCKELKSLGDISNWYIPKWKRMIGMFANCYSLNLNIKKWKLDKNSRDHIMPGSPNISI